MSFTLSDPQWDQFRRDGFVIVERLFDREEIDWLSRIARADHLLDQQAASRRDGEGGVIRLSVRNALEDDIYSAFVRCRRVVDAMATRSSSPTPSAMRPAAQSLTMSWVCSHVKVASSVLPSLK